MKRLSGDDGCFFGSIRGALGPHEAQDDRAGLKPSNYDQPEREGDDARLCGTFALAVLAFGF